MANFYYNKIILHGDDKEIKKLFNMVESNNNRFDFDKIIPMPDCLSIKVSENIVDLVKETNPNVSKLSTHDKALYNQCFQNLKDTGYAYWNDWRLDKWGTSWNAVDAEINENTIIFQTASGEPTPVIENLSKTFPSILLDWYYLFEVEDHVYEHILFGGETIRKIENMPYDYYWANIYFDFFPGEKEEFALYIFPDSREFYFRWQNVFGVKELDEDEKGELFVPFL